MTTCLYEASEIKEIILKDEKFHARLECEVTKYLLPNYTKVDFKLIENTFQSIDKSNFERYWSVNNTITNIEDPESYLVRHLRILFKTETKPTFKEVAANRNKI